MNQPRQKILFISCLGGMGHVRAAKALLASATENHPELTCGYIDVVDYCNWLLRASAVDSYELLIKYWPELYKKIYQYTDTPEGKNSFEKSSILWRQGNQKLLDYIEMFEPDRVIATHFIVPTLLAKFAKHFPIDMVVTDYYANRVWVHPDVRHLFVASDTIKQAFKDEHPSIIVSGIPINPRFFKPKNAVELKKKFGLNVSEPVILILSGGSGLIDTSIAAEKILTHFKKIAIVAIAGKNNPELLAKLQNLEPNGNQYRVLEFVDTIDEWMTVADAVVTKPGGLTTSEVLYLKKPLVMINPIPGQEEKNARFVTEHNYGRLVSDVSELPMMLTTILTTPNFLTTPPSQANPNEIILTVED